MFVYIQSEKQLWTVGHYEPGGKFIPESDHDTTESAAARVHFLNGGKNPQLMSEIDRLRGVIQFMKHGAETNTQEKL